MVSPQGKDKKLGRSRELSLEDHEVWRAFVRDVRRLKESKAHSDVIASPTHCERRGPPVRNSHRQPNLKEKGGDTDPAQWRAARPVSHTKAMRLSIGQRPSGIDDATWSALIDGRIRAQRRLDLHGHSLQSAFEALHKFLDDSVSSSLRCIEVITGLGGLDNVGAVRREFPFWLERDPLRKHILCAVYSQKKNLGAVKIYLKAHKRLGKRYPAHFKLSLCS